LTSKGGRSGAKKGNGPQFQYYGGWFDEKGGNKNFDTGKKKVCSKGKTVAFGSAKGQDQSREESKINKYS